MRYLKTILAILILSVSCTGKNKSQLAQIDCIDIIDSAENSNYYYVDVQDDVLNEIYWLNGNTSNKILTFHHTYNELAKADNKVPIDSDSTFYFTTNDDQLCSCRLLDKKEVQKIHKKSCINCNKLSNSNQPYCQECIKFEATKCLNCKTPIYQGKPYQYCNVCSEQCNYIEK